MIRGSYSDRRAQLGGLGSSSGPSVDDSGFVEGALGLTAANSTSSFDSWSAVSPFKTLQALESRSGLALSRLAEIIGIPERTLARRKVSRKLTPEESERLLRISSVFEDAVDLFEGECGCRELADHAAESVGDRLH